MIPPQGNVGFVAAMERVLEIYRRPCDAAFAVVCMDEIPRQLIGETRTPMCVGAGHEGREDYEYRRLGTCNVFMASEPLAGRRITKVTQRRTKSDWAHFLNEIAECFAEAEKITLIMDNLNTTARVLFTRLIRQNRLGHCGTDLNSSTLRNTAVGSMSRKSRST